MFCMIFYIGYLKKDGICQTYKHDGAHSAKADQICYVLRTPDDLDCAPSDLQAYHTAIKFNLDIN